MKPTTQMSKVGYLKQSAPSDLSPDAQTQDRAALVERLTELHQNVRQNVQRASEFRVEAGNILLALRKTTPHGEWEPQLKELCKTAEMSRATAHNYMNLAKRGSVPKPNSEEMEKAKEIAQRLQDACRKAGLSVDISPSRELGKFRLIQDNMSEDEIQQAIDSTTKRGAA